MFETDFKDSDDVRLRQQTLKANNNATYQANVSYIAKLNEKLNQASLRDLRPSYCPGRPTNDIKDFTLHESLDVEGLGTQPSHKDGLARVRDPYSLVACINYLAPLGTLLPEELIFAARAKLFLQQANIHVNHQRRIKEEQLTHWGRFVDVVQKYSDTNTSLLNYKLGSLDNKKEKRSNTPQCFLPQGILGQLELVIRYCQATKLHEQTIESIATQSLDFLRFREYTLYPDYPNIPKERRAEFAEQSDQTYDLLKSFNTYYGTDMFILQIGTSELGDKRPVFTYILVDLRSQRYCIMDCRQSKAQPFTSEHLKTAMQARDSFSQLKPDKYNPVTAIYIIRHTRSRDNFPNAKSKKRKEPDDKDSHNRNKCPECGDEYKNGMLLDKHGATNLQISCRLKCRHDVCLYCIMDDLERCPVCKERYEGEINFGPAYERCTIKDLTT